MSTLLLYVPVVLYVSENNFFLEAQACNGLRLWAEHFDKIIYVVPQVDGEVPVGWRRLESAVGPSIERVEVHSVPASYTPVRFAGNLNRVRRQFRSLIERADYLCFALGGLVGDWGAVASIEAHKMNRPFSVWTDRVESRVVRAETKSGSWKSRVKAHLTHFPMQKLEEYIIRRADLGLFHGRETFDAYSPFCAQSELVHNIHLKKTARISNADLKEKKELSLNESTPLRIVYAGRASSMKGGMDWVEALSSAGKAGVNFEAVWLGDGEELEPMHAKAKDLGVANRIRFAGYVDDPQLVMQEMKAAQIFLFCHKTPESPRCLIEALVAGTPIVGYDSAYPADLISENGGGMLSPIHDTNALAKSLISLAENRTKLSSLIQKAASDGVPFNEDAVFQHRSDLIKKYL